MLLARIPEPFEATAEALGPLGARNEQLINVFAFVRFETLIGLHCGPGRPAKDRVAQAHAFLAKAIFGLSTLRDLIERLSVDRRLRRHCGWPSARAVPSEATYSRAFAEFAAGSLPTRLH